MSAAQSSSGVVKAIAIRPQRRAPMELQNETFADKASGLSGDANRKPGRSQVTIVSAEKWAEACADLGAAPPWTYRRANILVEGLDLDVRVGARLAVGDAVLEVTMETDPCARMDAQHAGLTRALQSDARGGVRCRIIESGQIMVGAPVRWLAGEEPGEGGASPAATGTRL